MPTPSESDLQRRALAHVTAGPVKFDPISLLILGAILSAVISHLVQKCLNHIDPVAVRGPGIFKRWQLRRLVRQKCSDPAVLQAAVVDGLDARAIDRAWGDVAYDALLKTGASLSEPEAVALTQGR